MPLVTPRLPQGYRIAHFAELASTNSTALARAQRGEAGRLWIVADSQSGGRGRAGRRWQSRPGNLHASLLIRPGCSLERALELPLVGGIAAFDAVRQVVRWPHANGLYLKWPNDILWDGAKLGGILLESTTAPESATAPRNGVLGDVHSTEDSGQTAIEGAGQAATPGDRKGSLAVVLGFGINLAWHPEGLGGARATSLAALGHHVSPDVMLAALAASLSRWLGLWNRGAGFALIRHAWLARGMAPGSPTTVKLGARTVFGVFEGLDARGALLLRDESGTRHHISAGDVLFEGQRGAPEQALGQGASARA